ncbi:hypothetical protein SELR_pSRC500120 (plasmid) [Selenomonas ruminantium subsp. lactilytica TAM6421]|uniref:Uncharacterized protein n=1 Tax=Selenomonas ruminantium subsp. lactilytica (strain NBRC 103574 / TAM6421) TaxID=927704 RepID=I0GWP9_SELRL|nr:hypothetical protein [Selenomonas ruminantium]BAL85186.1 hypothetical protein SELR_pSRC500120 [Selenomonas ruminantium subsp. lactilytica TAM6421]
MGTFHNANSRIGKLGEGAAAEYFINALDATKVEDLSKIPEWQAVDVDMRVTLATGFQFLAEVKADSKDFGSILVEIVSNDTKPLDDPKRLGWIYKTKADIIYVYKSWTMSLYALNRRQLLEFVQKVGSNYHWCYGYTNDKNGRLLYRSKNLIIPRKELIDAGILREVAMHTTAPIRQKDGEYVGFGSWYRYNPGFTCSENVFRAIALSTNKIVPAA